MILVASHRLYMYIYRVINGNTSGSLREREILWEHELQASVSTAFRVLPNFHECFYNSIETRRTCFLFLLGNTAAKKWKRTCWLRLSKCQFSLLAPSLCQQLVLVLCFYRVMETRFLTNQRAYFLRIVIWIKFASANVTGGGVWFPSFTLHFGCLLHYFQLYCCGMNGNF